MDESNDIYNTIKDCTYYLNSKNHSKYIKIWALDNYADNIQEQLCKQLETDELINVSSKQSTTANNMHTHHTDRHFSITYPNERNYGNEYENIYNNNYRDMLEPFGTTEYKKENIVFIIGFVIFCSLLYYKYCLNV